MAAASNAQVQAFVDNNVRPRCEQIRALLIAMETDQTLMGDIYENVNDAGSTWVDKHSGNPPHLLTRTDVLAWNTFLANLIAVIRGTIADGEKTDKGDAVDNVSAQLPIMMKGCVRGI